jgi:hypothetical protein
MDREGTTGDSRYPRELGGLPYIFTLPVRELKTEDDDLECNPIQI